MKKLTTQKGFTLVELAIVMTIIGLLIGGILKGQELMQTARVTSTVAQIKAFEAAITNFRDSFSAVPGDMPLAQARLQGCTAGCTNTTAIAALTGGVGDGIVGTANWAATAGGPWAAQIGAAAIGGTAAQATVAAETWQFWNHLLMANLISGVTDEVIRAATLPAWGTTHPAAKIAGGFIVGNTAGALAPGSSATNAGAPVTGLTLAIVATPSSAVNTGANTQALTPSRAAQIDRKMDDGRPTVGYVQAFGATAGAAGCQEIVNYGYNESSSVSACGLLFRIQG
jgi:prepilin-type N-terminal cleavage/methylation domain-containing protein